MKLHAAYCKAKLAMCLASGVLFTLASCSVTRHIAEPEEVVSRVHVEVDGKSSSDNTLQLAIAQHPYHRTFGLFPFAAWIWHNDSTTWLHRTRAKMGTQPPIYDELLSFRSTHSMQRALINQGYHGAKVEFDTVSNHRKVEVTYRIERGLPLRIATKRLLVEDPLLQKLVDDDARHSLIVRGHLLDRNTLEEERTRLTGVMRDNGFFDFNKEDVSFIADTIAGSKMVDLTMVVSGIHDLYTIRKLKFVTNYDLLTGETTGESDYIRPSLLAEKCHIVPGEPYSETLVRKTYSAYSRLHILKYVNIRFEQVPGEQKQLDCTIYMSPATPNAVQFELDGTNTSGDLGFAAALTYQHRNLFHGSESYTATVKGGYESLTGDLSGLVNNNYTEYSVENQIDFPRFLFPFISTERRRSINANTAVKATYSYQSRPEYTRIILQGGLGYKWSDTEKGIYHTLDAIDLSYVYLPKRSESFLQIIQNAGPISYKSYTSHLILSSGYNLYAGNNRNGNNTKAEDIWSLRLNPEIGGNVLKAVSAMAHFKKSEGRHMIFDLPFEQYAKFDTDWSYSKYLSDRNRLAFHLAGGVAVPYGNSEVMPFEKRYYSGGANSVRGWNVRTLGPGRYHNNKADIDYFNQCGDVRFDASVELRSKMFWKFEGALFADAGNVWTLKEYDSQPEGAISSSFYKEIALAWGMGLRVVTDFVVLRLDWGFKAFDPSLTGSDAWLITNPLKSSNSTLHFAVGYPF